MHILAEAGRVSVVTGLGDPLEFSRGGSPLFGGAILSFLGPPRLAAIEGGPPEKSLNEG